MNHTGSVGNRRHYGMLLLVLLLFLYCGIMVLLAVGETDAFSGRGMLSWRGVVVSQPKTTAKVCRADILVVEVGGKEISPFKTRATISSRNAATGDIPVSVGHAVACVSAFKRLADSGKYASYGRYLLSQGVKNQTFIQSRNICRTKISDSSIPLLVRMRISVAEFRQRLSQTYSQLGICGDELAVVRAMTLGDRTLIEVSLRDVYSVSGASHVLALSGLHLGIIYSLLLMLLWRRNRLLKWQMAVNFIIILTLWSYVVFVGMPVSAVRSASMLTLCTLARVASRGNHHFGILAMAALLIVSVSPLSVFDVGFQMSFLSVASIQLLASPLYEWLAPQMIRRIAPLRWLCSLTAVSVAAQVGVAPLVANCFSRFSCYFLLTNIVAIPLATILLYLALAVVLTSPLPALQTVVGWALHSVTQLLNDSLRIIAALPDASVENIQLSGMQTILIYLFMALVYFAVKVLRRGKLYKIRYGKYPSVGYLQEKRGKVDRKE